MKKVISSVAILSLCFFAACNSDDNNDNNVSSRCVVCSTDISGNADEYTIAVKTSTRRNSMMKRLKQQKLWVAAGHLLK